MGALGVCWVQLPRFPDGRFVLAVVVEWLIAAGHWQPGEPDTSS